eukprot:gene32303-18552_t
MLNAIPILLEASPRMIVVLLITLLLSLTTEHAAAEDFDFNAPISAEPGDEVVPQTKRRGFARAGRFFLMVMVVTALVVLINQLHKRSKTVQ